MKNKPANPRNERFWRKFLPAAVVFFIAVFSVSGLIIFSGKSENNKVDNKNGGSPSVLSAVSTPTVSPSPMPSPTPIFKDAALVFAGYCIRVPVLMYHHIEPMAQAKNKRHTSLTVDSGEFDKQMSYLVSSGYTTITADQLAAALINHGVLPAKSIVITMDDGYSDIFNYAFPILKKYNLKANLMIATGLVENPGYLTWGQLREMVGSSLVTAYDHTWSHNSLPADSREKAQNEILTAKKQLEQNLGKTVDIFAYPYGSQNARVINLLREDGFVAAFSTIRGVTQCSSYIMSLHRTRIGNAPLSSYGI